MPYTFTSTGRLFITNPYSDTDTNNVSYTSQQLLDYLSNIDKEQFHSDGYLITKEYTINGKYIYPVIAFSHHIFTPTGKFQKSFKKSVENQSYEEDWLPSSLSDKPYENWS